MDTEIIVLLCVFGISIVAGVTTMLIRKYGKDQGIETADIEQGIDTAKDTAISELKKQGTNDKIDTNN